MLAYREHAYVMESTEIWSGHPSWRSAMMMGLGVRAIGACIAVTAVLYGIVHFDKLSAPVGALVGAGVWMALIGAAEVVRRSTTYRITSDEIVKEYGIVIRRDPSVPIRQIVTSEAEQTILERLTGTGSVKFATAANDPSIDDIIFEGVANPKAISAKYKAARNGAYRPAPEPAEIPNRYSSTPPVTPGQVHGQPGGYASMPGEAPYQPAPDNRPLPPR